MRHKLQTKNPLLIQYENQYYIVYQQSLFQESEDHAHGLLANPDQFKEISKAERKQMKSIFTDYYKKVCRDQRDIVVLEDINEMSLHELIHLIPSSSDYCYKYDTISFLDQNMFIDPFTNRPFSEKTMFYYNNINLMLMGIFDFGPLKGFETVEKYLIIPNSSSLINFKIKLNENKSHTVVSVENVDGQEAELAVLDLSNVSKREMIKAEFQRLWDKGFFLNSWAQNLLEKTGKIGVYFYKDIPYLIGARVNSVATDKFLNYIRGKLEELK
jgi:hypothetical protein